MTIKLRMQLSRVAGSLLPRGRGARGAAEVPRLGMRSLLLAAPVAVLLAVLAPALTSAQPAGSSTPAGGAAPGAAASLTEGEERLAHKQAEREERAAKRKAELEAVRVQRRTERSERAARERARRLAESGTRPSAWGGVEIGCSQVTYNFNSAEQFPEKTTTTVREIISINGTRLPPVLFTFEGPIGSNTVPITEEEQPHVLAKIDAFAQWVRTSTVDGRTVTVRHGWDIPASRVCEHKEEPGFGIEKLQVIAGTNGRFVPTPLTGEVGHTVEYEIIVTNTGDETLTFSNFSDPKCDPGTITGGPGTRPLEPGGSAKYRCQHLLTAADQVATTYTNVASVTGTPIAIGSAPINHTSNTVVVNVPAPRVTPVLPGAPPQSSLGPAPSTSPGSGTLATTSSQAPRIETLAATASAPGLSGRPEGCVRSSFLVTVKASHVKSVTFYLDGHRLKTLTAKSASKGRLSIRIQTRRLKVGVHRITARITMIPTAASVKAVTAVRSLKFARCASAAVSPKFTG
jgi:hypothetical protein